MWTKTCREALFFDQTSFGETVKDQRRNKEERGDRNQKTKKPLSLSHNGGREGRGRVEIGREVKRFLSV